MEEAEAREGASKRAEEAAREVAEALRLQKRMAGFGGFR